MSHRAGRQTSDAQVPAMVSAGFSRLNVAPLCVAAGTDFQNEGEEKDTVYLVDSGWVASCTDLSRGQGQILYLHQAGDIAGFAGLGSKTASCPLRSLTTVGRMKARHRVVWLILMLHDRVVGDSGDRMFEIPLNQSEIGDFVWLTNMSVSKMFSRLSEEGFSERKGRKILVRRLADTQSMMGYQTVPCRPEAMFASGHARTGKLTHDRALSD